LGHICDLAHSDLNLRLFLKTNKRPFGPFVQL
jgi:hypothetical protein